MADDKPKPDPPTPMQIAAQYQTAVKMAAIACTLQHQAALSRGTEVDKQKIVNIFADQIRQTMGLPMSNQAGYVSTGTPKIDKKDLH